METTQTTVMKKLERPGYMNIVYFISKTLFAMLTLCELYYFASFMTDSALLATSLVAMVLSVTSTVDLIFSFFIGVILEVVHLPWGKYRSWLLIAPPIVTISIMLMFSKISSNQTVSAVIIIIGFIISHIFWSIGEAALNAMPLAMTDDLKQRASLSIWGGRGSMANTLIFGVIAMPLVNLFYNMTGSNVWGYSLMALVMSILYWISFWWLFYETKGCEETSSDRKLGKKHENTLIPAIKGAVTNPHLLTMMFCVACTFCYMILQSSSMFYFFSYSLGGGKLLAFMGTFISLISVVKLVGSFLVPFYLKIFKGSKRAVYLLGFVGVAIFDGLAYILNPGPIPTMVLIQIGNFFGCSSLAMQLGLYMDCAVYSEYKTGKDVKGFVMSLMNMPVKIGITVKNYIISAVLVAINYSATATETSGYGDNFKMLFLMIPVIICVVCVIVNLLFYHLNEDKVSEMQAKIEAKNAAAN